MPHVTLNYVINNQAKHGLMRSKNYRRCSARWFAQNSTPGFNQQVRTLKANKLQIGDDFDGRLVAWYKSDWAEILGGQSRT